VILDELARFKDSLISYLALRRRVLKQRERLTKQEREKGASIYDDISTSAGRFAPLIRECTGLETIRTSLGLEDIWGWALSFEDNAITLLALDKCIQATGMAIGRLQEDISAGIRNERGYRVETISSQAHQEPPRVFVAHGGPSEARDKLRRFLTALGITPLVIEEAPREGRSVNQQVEHYLKQAECAIVLGTADDKELKDGKLYPRRNVCIEIGRFQERLASRTVFLLEEGAYLPSNASEKIYTRFTQDSMDEAFITIVTELRASGMLKIAQPRTAAEDRSDA